MRQQKNIDAEPSSSVTTRLSTHRRRRLPSPQPDIVCASCAPCRRPETEPLQFGHMTSHHPAAKAHSCAAQDKSSRNSAAVRKCAQIIQTSESHSISPSIQKSDDQGLRVYKKFPDRYGKTARTRTCRAIRVGAPASTKDAS